MDTILWAKQPGRRERRAMRRGNYAQAQWYMLESLRRWAKTNVAELRRAVLEYRNPLCGHYVGM